MAWAAFLTSIPLPVMVSHSQHFQDYLRGWQVFTLSIMAPMLSGDPAQFLYPGALFFCNVPVLATPFLLDRIATRTVDIYLFVTSAFLLIALMPMFKENLTDLRIGYFTWLASLIFLVITFLSATDVRRALRKPENG